MGRENGVSAGRLLAAGVTMLMVIASITLVASPVAAAQDDEGPDAEFDSRVVTLVASYEIDPENGRVLVNETVTIRNVRGSTRSGNVRTDYFWTGHTVWAGFDAQNLSIASNGAELAFEEVDEVEELVKVYSVAFPTNLNFGQTRVLDISYELPSYADDNGPRRINSGFFDLELVTCCNFEEITIEVTAPDSFVVTAPTDIEFTRSVEGSTQVWSFSDSELSGDFTDFVVGDWFGSDFDGFEAATVDLGGATGTIFGYPDDAAWNVAMSTTVRSVSGSMQQFTGGNQWGQADPTFVQVPDRADDQIPQFGVESWDDGDASVSVPTTVPQWAIALSVARPYVNESNFAIDWMTESTVRDMASRSLDELLNAGGPEPSEPEGRVTSAREGGFWFVRQLTDEIGYDGLLELERLAGTAETAFVGEGVPEQSVTIDNDWRRLLDLGEQRLGMSNLASLLQGSVLRDEEIRELGERTATIERYDELRARVGIDEGPLGIRDGLTNWQFSDVNAMIDAANRSLDEADEVADLADAAGLDFDADVADGWLALASIADFESLGRGLDDQRDAIAAIAAAQARLGDDRGYVSSLGFDDAAASGAVDQAQAAFNNGDLDGVDVALADFAAIEDDASGAGRTKLLTRVVLPIAGGVLLLVGLGLFLRRRSAGSDDVAPVSTVAAASPAEVVYPSAPPQPPVQNPAVIDLTDGVSAATEPYVDGTESAAALEDSDEERPPPPPTVTRF